MDFRVVQVVECLPSKHKAPNSTPNTNKNERERERERERASLISKRRIITPQYTVLIMSSKELAAGFNLLQSKNAIKVILKKFF
jgi:hypothetical protein